MFWLHLNLLTFNKLLLSKQLRQKSYIVGDESITFVQSEPSRKRGLCSRSPPPSVLHPVTQPPHSSRKRTRTVPSTPTPLPYIPIPVDADDSVGGHSEVELKINPYSKNTSWGLRKQFEQSSREKMFELFSQEA